MSRAHRTRKFTGQSSTGSSNSGERGKERRPGPFRGRSFSGWPVGGGGGGSAARTLPVVVVLLPPFASVVRPCDLHAWTRAPSSAPSGQPFRLLPGLSARSVVLKGSLDVDLWLLQGSFLTACALCRAFLTPFSKRFAFASMMDCLLVLYRTDRKNRHENKKTRHLAHTYSQMR
jgi:hypothetical protein